MNSQLSDIQRKVLEIGGSIDAPRSLLLIHDGPVDDGAPYIEIGKEGFEYISSERGYEIFRRVAPSLDILLYWIFERVTSRLAMEYELKNRIEGQDSRRVYFSRKIELMSVLDPRWAEMLGHDIERILSSAPYVD